MSLPVAVPRVLLAPLFVLAVVALIGCNRPADEVEPTPPLLELRVPGVPQPPSIDPVPLPPADPSVPAPPDPRGPLLPDPVDTPEPVVDPLPTEATGTPVA